MASQLYNTYDISGQVVLVTGASSGFGEAIAWRCAELGCKLILVARREDRLQAIADQLREKYSAAVHVVSMDVRNLDAVAALPAQLPQEFSEVSILINNAGLALGTSPAQDNLMEDMRIMLETNVLAVMAFTKAFLGSMVARNKGHIVNIGSTAGHESYPGGSGYCASKHALRAFTSATRDDVVSSNVRITLISPGAAETEFSIVRFKGDADRAAKVYEGMAAMNAADVADQVVYAITRPEHVQIADIVVMSVHQAGAKTLARPLLQK
eukprot:CAMPEP_0202892846 /NCGR_PEP_ID=MMETSP1392-20130828/2528_1 /ASSEMBLY_ACC=CAM_ASM_000868 /TAXON_ID=225041 /ORGANISM="Chlamydomonas chlamydogama, Strain SAG 11-48b" /LENGTH=267 /DNA_ID=CAMNT_0049576953 /DNA_START=116 /DNA_END=919 /DNA_ORIENTATION=-